MCLSVLVTFRADEGLHKLAKQYLIISPQLTAATENNADGSGKGELKKVKLCVKEPK